MVKREVKNGSPTSCLKIDFYAHTKIQVKNSYQMINENEKDYEKNGKKCKIQMGKPNSIKN